MVRTLSKQINPTSVHTRHDRLWLVEMAHQRKETLFTIDRLWAASLKLHEEDWDKPYKCSKLSDRLFFDFCNKNIQGLDARFTLNKFFSEYGVARTLHEDWRESFFEIIRDVSVSQRCAGFHERQKTLDKALINGKEKWKFKSGKKAYPKSAASKISWFVAPSNWTIYDSYAVRALETIKDDTNRIERLNFETFYKRLESLNVLQLEKAISKELELNIDFSKKQLLGSRVIDKMLWIMGSHDYFKRVSSNLEEKYLSFAQALLANHRCHALNLHLMNRWGVAIK